MVSLLLGLGGGSGGGAAESLLPPMGGRAEDFALRRAGVECNAAIKIDVTREGLHRLTYAALTNSGVPPPSLIGDRMRLFCRTQEVAISVSTDGQWGASDSLLFWGKGFEGTHTATNAYWLGFGSDGLRMDVVDGSERGWPLVTTCVQRVVFNPKLRYVDKSWFSEDFDHWLAAVVTNGALVIPFKTVFPVTNGTAALDLVMYGYTSDLDKNPDHGTEIKLNGVVLCTHTFDGNAPSVMATNFPASKLVDANTFSLRQTLPSGVTNDTSYLREIGVTYERRLEMDTNVLVFRGKTGSNTYEVSRCLAATNLWVVDITEPTQPLMMSGFTVTTIGVSNNTVHFGVNAVATGTYAIGTGEAIISVPGSCVSRVAFRGLGDMARQADYVIVCPSDFRSQVYRLLRYRYRHGRSVVVAPVEDIYNEFGYGVCDPVAIKQFMGYAFHYWRRPAPGYALLVGTGSYDPRNFLNLPTPAPELVPVHLGMTSYKWTALDGWYVQVNGTNDNVPDMMMGRIPVESVSALKHVVDKVLAFEADANSDARGYTLLAADNGDGVNDFKSVCERLKFNVLQPAGLIDNSTAYLGVDSIGTVRTTITTNLNQGVLVATYVGHGDAANWADEGMFTTNDVANLTNTNYPIVCMMTCENGSFQTPTSIKSLAEVFLSQLHGAAGCLAASAVTTVTNSDVMATGFLRGLVQDKRHTVGEAVADGYDAITTIFGGNATELLYLIYFGDPAMVVNP